MVINQQCIPTTYLPNKDQILVSRALTIPLLGDLRQSCVRKIAKDSFKKIA